MLVSSSIVEIIWTGRVKYFANRNKVYGVKYLDNTTTNCDGMFQGRRYFDGPENKCKFIKYSQIHGHWIDEIEFKQCVAHAAHLQARSGMICIDGSSDRMGFVEKYTTTRWVPTAREMRNHQIRCVMSDGAYNNMKSWMKIMQQSKYSNTKI